MGLPNINIEFKTTAASAIERSERGVVGIIIKDAASNGAFSLTKTSQIPAELGTENKAYIARAFYGYISPPKKVILYVQPSTAADLSEGLAYMVTQSIDYLAGPPNITETECASVVSWVKEQRADGYTPKAVLPNTSADSEAIINFTTNDILVGDTEYTAAQYCSRIAGLIAGTPLTISCTYAPLSEVTGVESLTKDQLDAAIDDGRFVIFYDGEKVKVGRGVNSLQTTTQDKGAAFKKIKVVEAVDMMNSDIRMTAQDSYIGKYANSYDNKCLLIGAIKGYFSTLETQGVLKIGSDVGIDVAAQEDYLQAQGIITDDMNAQQIKEANTGDKVFLTASASILDAIEDISLTIVI